MCAEETFARPRVQDVQRNHGRQTTRVAARTPKRAALETHLSCARWRVSPVHIHHLVLTKPLRLGVCGGNVRTTARPRRSAKRQKTHDASSSSNTQVSRSGDTPVVCSLESLSGTRTLLRFAETTQSGCVRRKRSHDLASRTLGEKTKNTRLVPHNRVVCSSVGWIRGDIETRLVYVKHLAP